MTLSPRPIRIFVPVDAAALSVGAEAVARSIAQAAQERGVAIEIARNGSRGMLPRQQLAGIAAAALSRDPPGRSTSGIRPKSFPGCSLCSWQIVLGPIPGSRFR
jgi:hypothetical protein